MSVRRELGWAAAIVVAVIALDAFQLCRFDHYVFDEVYQAYTAGQLARGNATAWLPGTVEPRTGTANEWTHPPLSKLLIEIGILALGDRPFGWRFPAVLFGALGVGLVFLAGTRWFGRRVGTLAALFLALDGLWFGLSRLGTSDIFLSVFVLAGFLAWSRWVDGPGSLRWLVLTGVCLGLALATKWSGLPALGLLGLATAVLAWRSAPNQGWRGRTRALAQVTFAMALVPAAVYLASYGQFFAMGYGAGRWLELQQQMWRYHAHLAASHPWASPWWSWPLLLRPIWYATQARGGLVYQVFGIGNPVLWWAFLPALAALLWRLAEDPRGRWRESLVAMGFLGNWLPWALSPRISFLYHMLPSVPFGCLAVAHTVCIGLADGRWRAVRLAYPVAVTVCFLFFYPHLAGTPLLPTQSRARYWLPGWDPTRSSSEAWTLSRSGRAVAPSRAADLNAPFLRGGPPRTREGWPQ